MAMSDTRGRPARKPNTQRALRIAHEHRNQELESSALVVPQVVLATERLAADLAVERPLVRVRALVDQQVVALRELVRAEPADVLLAGPVAAQWPPHRCRLALRPHRAHRQQPQRRSELPTSLQRRAQSHSEVRLQMRQVRRAEMCERVRRHLRHIVVQRGRVAQRVR